MDTDNGLAPASAVAIPRVAQQAPAGFERFFRENYRQLCRFAQYLGFTESQADEAVAAAMREMLRRWAEIKDPTAYARRAVVHNAIKAKERGDLGNLDRIRDRMVERRTAPPEAGEDPDMVAWENEQWVIQLLESLSPAQREVVEHVVNGFTPTEIAELLGKSPAAIRQRLHAARERLERTGWRQQHTDGRPTAGSAAGEGK